MAMVCPMKGCKEKPGMCIHDKIMIAVIVVVIIVVVVSLLQ